MTAFASRRLADHFGEFVVRDGRCVGVKFACPHCHDFEGAPTIAVLFANPLGGGPAAADDHAALGNNEGRRWNRSGDSIETLTLTPSVDCSTRGHWHGFVTNGDVA